MRFDASRHGESIGQVLAHGSSARPATASSTTAVNAARNECPNSATRMTRADSSARSRPAVDDSSSPEMEYLRALVWEGSDARWSELPAIARRILLTEMEGSPFRELAEDTQAFGGDPAVNAQTCAMNTSAAGWRKSTKAFSRTGPSRPQNSGPTRGPLFQTSKKVFPDPNRTPTASRSTAAGAGSATTAPPGVGLFPARDHRPEVSRRRTDDMPRRLPPQPR